jgi:hypothetical protein
MKTIEEKYNFLLDNLHRIEVTTVPSFDNNTDWVAVWFRSFNIDETKRVWDTTNNQQKLLDDAIEKAMQKIELR